MTLRQIAERYGLTSDGVDFALSQYQIVISEITRGMMSKLSYYAKDIIQVAQERWCDTCDLKAVSGWISVKDRLPEEHADEHPYAFEQYLCATVWNDVQMVGFGTRIGDDKQHFWSGTSIWDDWVTHWMPLPEPPKEEEHER